MKEINKASYALVNNEAKNLKLTFKKYCFMKVFTIHTGMDLKH